MPKYSHYDELQNEHGISVMYTKSAVGGQSEKMFVRMDSAFLTDFFADIAKGDTSYVTYIDDIAKDYATTGKAPLSAVSLLMKLYDSGCKYGYMEDVGSRLGNLLGIPVVYNKAFRVGSVNYVASIDYMKFDPKLKYGILEGDYYTGTYDTHKEWNYSKWLDFFECSVIKNKHNGKMLRDSQLYQIERGFTTSYFFRKYLLEDPDFDLHNMSIIYNEAEDSYSFGPNYDMERAHVEDRNKFAFEVELARDMKEAFEMFPYEMKAFMDRLLYIKQNKLIKPEFFPNIRNGFTKNKIIKRLNKNISDVCEAYVMYREQENEGM